MRKPLLLSLGAFVFISGTQLAQAQRGPVNRGAIRQQRQQNKSTGAGASVWGQRAAAAAANGGGATGGGATGGGATGGGTNGNGGVGGNGTTGTGGGNGMTGGGSIDPAAQSARTSALRALMNAAGITDTPTQNAVITFIYQEEIARRPLLAIAQEAIAQINQTAGTQAGGLTAVAANPNANPADTAGDDPGLSKYQDYLNALGADTARYNQDLQDLDAKIGYSKKPRLEAFLTLIGVLDNDTYGFGGPAAVFQPTTQQIMQQARSGATQAGPTMNQ